MTVCVWGNIAKNPRYLAFRKYVNNYLIISSNWRWFYVEVLSRESHKKYTKGNGQLLVAGKCLTLGGKGTRREALLGGDMIE